jgi:hypothetical protein
VGNPAFHKMDDRQNQGDDLQRYRDGYQRIADNPRTPEEEASLALLEVCALC